jgi:hypothetical protein
MRSYRYLMSDSGSAPGHYVELQESKLFDLIRTLLAGADIDETWYLKTNPDVARAIRAGGLKSAKDHYIKAGYFENRLPRPAKVDEAWYLAEYPDVAEALRSGAVASASSHFEQAGFMEGRLPHKGWSILKDNDHDSDAEVSASRSAAIV